MDKKKKTNKNTVCVKKSDLDQFYTATNIAQNCYDKLLELYPNKKFSLFFEPAAGTGSFFNLFPINQKLGIDLDPKCDGVIMQDFLKFSPPENEIIATISNPPFGKNASLAVKFFNKAAEFSEIIAFIVPKTFKKQSLQNRLNLNFKLKLNIDLPQNAFVLNNEPYNVPCCFQIWERSTQKRKKIIFSLENEYFTFVKKEDADLAVRRVGGRTGKANKNVFECAEVSHYFLKLKNKKMIDQLVEKINSINFDKIINSTAGVKSLSKPEFVKTFLKAIN